MTKRKFHAAVKKEFGEKIVIGILRIDKESAQRSGITNTMLRKYGSRPWVAPNEKGEVRCPKCDAELLGLFGAFTWGIAHGYGFCGHCKKVEFQYYHYFKEGMAPMPTLAVSGF